MPVYNKPQFNSVWADSGEKLEPTSSKISTGWIVEIPPKEIQNWLQNRSDAFSAHVNQMGIPQWDATTEYQAQKSYVQGTSGVVYRALQTHTNRNPDTDVNGFWSVAFESSGTALLKSQNLADVPDKPLARQNLGIASTEDYDARYLRLSQNLSDVPNKGSARSNLQVYGTTEVYTKNEVLSLFPVGKVDYFAGSTAPSGYLIANGQAVSRTTYSRLFAYIGTLYGSGNGSTTFNIPDLRGEFLRGVDLGRGLDAGRTLASVQGSQNQSHTHTLNDPGHSHRVPGDFREGYAGNAFDSGSGGIGFYVTLEKSQTGVTANTSGGSEARPRNIALLPCISTGVFL